MVWFNEIEEVFVVLFWLEYMVVFEDCVVFIVECMEELLECKDYGEIVLLWVELCEVCSFVEQIDIKGFVEGIDDWMKFVLGCLDDLEVLVCEQCGFDSWLFVMEECMFELEIIFWLQGCLEDIVGMMVDDWVMLIDIVYFSQVDCRLDEIVDWLDCMEQVDLFLVVDSGVFEVLEIRLDVIL